MLEQAIVLAVQAHEGQTRANGHPYIEHPLRVMAEISRRRPGDVTAMAVAVLHDVVEDTDVTHSDILQLFGWEFGKHISTLTHDDEDTYEEYIKMIAENPVATAVKLADIADNLADLPYAPWPMERKMRIAMRYFRALTVLRTKRVAA